MLNDITNKKINIKYIRKTQNKQLINNFFLHFLKGKKTIISINIKTHKNNTKKYLK